MSILTTALIVGHFVSGAANALLYLGETKAGNSWRWTTVKNHLKQDSFWKWFLVVVTALGYFGVGFTAFVVIVDTVRQWAYRWNRG